MLTHDISRDSFQRSKNYSGIRQQQGRIPLDSEMNESYDIIADELRRAIKDVICSCGTPDDGFKIELNDNIGADGQQIFDLSIAAGTYYMGGERYDNLTPSTYRSQNDWQTFSIDMEPLVWQPNELHKFVWLEGWEQNITAIEDPECYERALGGPDGAGRRRRMTRIRLASNSADNCEDAMSALFSEGTIDHDECRVLSGITLTIGFTQFGPNENLCAPQTQGGFLGADNETFRFQITEPGRFIYGRNNAAETYKVEVGLTGGFPNKRRKITFLNRPKDAYAQPLSGQAIEIFRWATELPNGEKIAEPLGKLFTIDSDYDPEDGTLLTSDDVPASWVNDTLYARLWTGGSGNALQPDHAIIPGPIPLGTTGLTALFEGTNALAGDSWTAAARPKTPDKITPWFLLKKSPPMGPVRRVAPLAIVTRTLTPGAEDTVTITDCREQFTKLCKLGSCCTITVGDGKQSHGDTTTIAEAVERLPESGGEICLLAGHHTENVTLVNRKNIVFKGCGKQTLWEADKGLGQAALHMTGCVNIRLTGLMMKIDDRYAVLAGQADHETPNADKNKKLQLDNLNIVSEFGGAIAINGCTDFKMQDCLVDSLALKVPRGQSGYSGDLPAIFVLGRLVLIEHNRLFTRKSTTVATRPLNGVQIGGQSRFVTIRDNIIGGGGGHGITLGHIEWLSQSTIQDYIPYSYIAELKINKVTGSLAPATNLAAPRSSYAARYEANSKPITSSTLPTPITGAITGSFFAITRTPQSGGNIRHLVIDDNYISHMGQSGISVAHFFDMEEQPDYIEIKDVIISNNHIEQCLQNEMPDIPLSETVYRSHGVVAFSYCERLQVFNNRIYDNGLNVRSPNCGVFIVYGLDLSFTSNRIYNNGAQSPARSDLPYGRRGGVIICLAATSLPEPSKNNAKLDVRSQPRATQTPALVFLNNYIDSKHGQALKLTALGPVQISDNKLNGAGKYYQNIAKFLTGNTDTNTTAKNLASRDGLISRGLPTTEAFLTAMGGQSVSVFNLGIMEDILSYWRSAVTSGGDGADNLQAIFNLLSVGGETMLDNNQITLSAHSPINSKNLSAVLIISLDDVSIQNNQIECENNVLNIFANTVAFGGTVRVMGNRFQERLPSQSIKASDAYPFTTFFSAMTFGFLLNTTTHNHGTHCIVGNVMVDERTNLNLIQNGNMSIINNLGISGKGDLGYCGKPPFSSKRKAPGTSTTPASDTASTQKFKTWESRNDQT